MFDYILSYSGDSFGSFVMFKADSSAKWGEGGVSSPNRYDYLRGTGSGVAGESPSGRPLTKLYGNTNSSSSMPAYQTLYAWRRTA